MTLYDISLPVRTGMPRFPDDPEVVVEPFRFLGRGDPYNVSRLTLGSHTGTHLDAPRHFLAHGLSVDQLDLGMLNGPCRVVAVDVESPSVDLSDLPPSRARLDRVLFRTRNSNRWRESSPPPSELVELSLDAARALVRRKVRLVGMDGLSIERGRGGQFPVHRLLLQHGVAILEGLDLSDVRAGTYELHCLPLRLAGGDGAPARAYLKGR